MNGGRPVRVLLALPDRLDASCARRRSVPLRPLMHGPALRQARLLDRDHRRVAAALWRAHCAARARAAWPGCSSALGSLLWALGDVYWTSVLADNARHPRAVARRRRLPGLLPARLRGPRACSCARASRGAEAGSGSTALTAALAAGAMSAAVVLQAVLHTAAATGSASPPTSPTRSATSSCSRWSSPPSRCAAGAPTAPGRCSASASCSSGSPTAYYLVDGRQRAPAAPEPVDAGWTVGLVPLLGRRLGARARSAWPSRAAARRAHRLPLGFAAVGLACSSSPRSGRVNPLAVALAGASLLAVVRRARPDACATTPRCLRQPHEALTDALTGLGNRRALDADLDRLAAGRAPTAARAGALRPRRLQALQRLLRPSRRRRAARAPGRQPRPRTSRARGTRLPDGRRRVLRAARAGDGGPPSWSPRAAAALSERGDGFAIGCSFGASCCPARRTTPATRCASPTSACTRTSTAAARRRAARAATCCSARWPSATPSSASTSAASPSWPGRRARGWGSTREEVEQVRHAAELHDVGKVAIPDAILDKPGAAGRRRVGVHPPPHDHRRADRRRGARAGPGGHARALDPRALRRRRLSRRARRRGDPARRPDRRGLRRLRRDGRRPPLPRRHGRRRRARRARALRRHPVRPGGRRGVRRRGHAGRRCASLRRVAAPCAPTG